MDNYLRSVFLAVLNIICFVISKICDYISIYWQGESVNDKIIDKERILVVRLDEIGDMVLMSPLLRELRRNKPQAEITLVVKASVMSMFEFCPYIDRVFGFDVQKGKFASLMGLFYARQFCIKKLLSQSTYMCQYDLSIVPRWDRDYGYFAGYVALFAMARRKIAYASDVNSIKARYDKSFDRFYTDLLHETTHVHEVERNLDILRYIGGVVVNKNLELWTSEKDEIFLKGLLPRKRAKGVMRIALFLSSGAAKREWPVDKYVEVMKLLQVDYQIEIILLGAGMHAADLGKVFVSRCRETKNMINQLTLRQTTALLRKCHVAFGGDTGPLHMAVAVGCPSLVLSCHPIGASITHVNAPERFGPWQAKHAIVLRPYARVGCEDGCCKGYAHCIKDIQVEEVVYSMKKLFSVYSV